MTTNDPETICPNIVNDEFEFVENIVSKVLASALNTKNMLDDKVDESNQIAAELNFDNMTNVMPPVAMTVVSGNDEVNVNLPDMSDHINDKIAFVCEKVVTENLENLCETNDERSGCLPDFDAHDSLSEKNINPLNV